MDIPEQLILLTRDFTRLSRLGHEQEAERSQVLEMIRVAGRTATFCGGFTAMTQLHDACEALTGNRNEIGRVLNVLWDGIGDWQA